MIHAYEKIQTGNIDAGDWRRGRRGKREVLSIPAGETVELIADPSPGNKTVEVLWEGRMVAMCTVGLNLWGIDTRTES